MRCGIPARRCPACGWVGVVSLSNGGFRLPVDVRPIWGKLGNGSRPHPLICHALDTAEVASQLFDLCLGPYLKNRLEAALEPLRP
ncbi:HD domain-containing protein [Streptomyces sp. CA-253872]|uniref:HD domain-containing protein n=1 Tax=Streptomyces sp. CA-253872 TaxID=3240067 RepID=UPI003D92DB2D